MTPRQALAFVRRHGVVLESAAGPVPSLAEAVAGGPIRGSWWAHPRGREIFALSRALRDSEDVLTCRAVGGKITFVHRRLWPALVRMAARIGRARLAQVREEHSPSGRHVTTRRPFPAWVPDEVARAAARLDEDAAASALGAWMD